MKYRMPLLRTFLSKSLWFIDWGCLLCASIMWVSMSRQYRSNIWIRLSGSYFIDHAVIHDGICTASQRSFHCWPNKVKFEAAMRLAFVRWRHKHKHSYIEIETVTYAAAGMFMRLDVLKRPRCLSKIYATVRRSKKGLFDQYYDGSWVLRFLFNTRKSDLIWIWTSINSNSNFNHFIHNWITFFSWNIYWFGKLKHAMKNNLHFKY